MTNIAILGMGIVGGGLYRAITDNRELLEDLVGGINIKYVLDKRSFPGHELEHRVTQSLDDIINDPSVEVVAETMGGDIPAYDFSLACIKAGKSVVTSNKLVVEKHGEELIAEAAKHGVKYLFEASVGGGIPVLHPIRECLASNRITAVSGILNGTTNYILERMEKDGCSFEEALDSARKLGYAEANPSADIEGLDAARKICILASVCFGGWYRLSDCSEITGISEVTAKDIADAAAEGCKIKLLGVAEKHGDKTTLCVKPCRVPCDDLLASVNGVFNCIKVTGDLVGEVAFYGHGAGGLATASAVLSDVVECIGKIK